MLLTSHLEAKVAERTPLAFKYFQELSGDKNEDSHPSFPYADDSI
jgi:hypothetical protein